MAMSHQVQVNSLEIGLFTKIRLAVNSTSNFHLLPHTMAGPHAFLTDEGEEIHSYLQEVSKRAKRGDVVIAYASVTFRSDASALLTRLAAFLGPGAKIELRYRWHLS